MALITPAAAQADRSVRPHVSASEPCSQSQISKYRSAVFDRASAPQQLWPLIASMICSTGGDDARIQTAYDHLPPKLRHSTEDLGMERTTETVERSRDLASEMTTASKVDYAELTVKTKSLVELQYSGGACSRQIDVRLTGRKWVIDEYVSGCD
ncbi:hypothetical protein ACLMLE_02325 [Lysobacter capsici]